MITMRKLPAACFTVLFVLASAAANAQQPSASGSQQAAEPAQVPKMPATVAEAKAIIAERFNAADTNNDGKLTRDEAKSGMPEVYKQFQKIDTRKRGYVTERQVGSYWQAKTKEQMQKENPIWN